ncbi:MAG: hypothetical protein U5L96_22180 [Owenweeksia sp.]|nr:hypothetical protein [Owenweeksia sp.]
MIKKLFITALSTGLLFSCQNSPSEADTTIDLNEGSDEIIDGPINEPENDAPERYEKGGLKIYPKEQVAQFKDASLKLNSPQDGAVLSSGEVKFDFEVSNYELGAQTKEARMDLANSDNGQHIHLIVDNNPYSAHYEADFSKKLETGHHYAIRVPFAQLSRKCEK